VGEFNSLATNPSRCHRLSTFPQSLSVACGVSTSAHSIPAHVHVDFKEGGGGGGGAGGVSSLGGGEGGGQNRGREKI